MAVNQTYLIFVGLVLTATFADKTAHQQLTLLPSAALGCFTRAETYGLITFHGRKMVLTFLEVLMSAERQLNAFK